ncbi:hypothetical protein ABG067_004143 [Albugo candida]
MDPETRNLVTEEAHTITSLQRPDKAISPHCKASNQAYHERLSPPERTPSKSSCFESIRRLPTPNNRMDDTISLNQSEMDDTIDPIASRSLQFRPWKKSQDVPSHNKWKSRAITDPFTRKHRSQHTPQTAPIAPKFTLQPLDPRPISEPSIENAFQPQRQVSTRVALADIERKRHHRRALQAQEKHRIEREILHYGHDSGYKFRLSTRVALADIERKRHHRRALQAQEKHRIEREILHYGHDSGYKFRRLIQQFRDQMLPSRSLHLPPLASTSLPGKLSVFIRKRPLTSKEIDAKGYDIITFPSSTEIICHEPLIRVDGAESLKHHSFHFDAIFDESIGNEDVYHATVGAFLPKLFDTFQKRQPHSLTVFAYGQTGSGKTYTMQSIYRHAAIDLFQAIERFSHADIVVRLSFYEMYRNHINDLLNHRKRVHLLESGDGVVQIVGLKEKIVDSLEALLKCISTGEATRSTSANAIHSDSSRSHAILRILLSNSQMCTSFSLVDLAGSERASDTQTDAKKTRIEGAEINKSLLALKECIRALHRGERTSTHRSSLIVLVAFLENTRNL